MPPQVNDESFDATHKESVSPDDELCRCIDALVDQLHEKAEEESRLGGMSAAERWRREDAVRQANASMFLERFTLSREAEERARRFINGKIDLPTFLQANPNRKRTQNSPEEDG